MKTFIHLILLLLFFSGCATNLKLKEYIPIQQSIKKEIRKKPILNINNIEVNSNIPNINTKWLKGVVLSNRSLNINFDTFSNNGSKVHLELVNLYSSRYWVKDNYREKKHKNHKSKEKNHKKHFYGHFKVTFHILLKGIYFDPYGKQKVFYVEDTFTVKDRHNTYYNYNYYFNMILKSSISEMFYKTRNFLQEPFEITSIRKHIKDNTYAIRLNGGTCDFMYIGQSVKIVDKRGRYIVNGTVANNSTCASSWIKTEETYVQPTIDDYALIIFN